MTFAYDGAGNRVLKVDPRGNRITYTYSALLLSGGRGTITPRANLRPCWSRRRPRAVVPRWKSRMSPFAVPNG